MQRKNVAKPRKKPRAHKVNTYTKSSGSNVKTHNRGSGVLNYPQHNTKRVPLYLHPAVDLVIQLWEEGLIDDYSEYGLGFKTFVVEDAIDDYSQFKDLEKYPSDSKSLYNAALTQMKLAREGKLSAIRKQYNVPKKTDFT